MEVHDLENIAASLLTQLVFQLEEFLEAMQLGMPLLAPLVVSLTRLEKVALEGVTLAWAAAGCHDSRQR